MTSKKEIQLRGRSKVIDTSSGQALTFSFRLGPIHVFCIANLPERDGNQEGPLVYIKLNFRLTGNVDEWEEYSTESPSPNRGHRR